MSAARRQPLTLRRILFQVHLWIGVALCIPLFMLGITGSLLVFDHELEALVGEGPPAASATGEMRPLVDIIAAAQKAAPSGLVPSMIRLPEVAGEPATVGLAQRGRQGPGPGGRRVYVDPVTLDVLGMRDPQTGIVRQIFLLHANLMMRDRVGREIIGWFGVAMCVLGVSGLVLWWPAPGRLRAALGVSRDARGFRLLREMHGAAGIWGLVVFIIVSFSGVYLAFPPIGSSIATTFGVRDLRGAFNSIRVEPVQGVRPADADQAVTLARAAVPDSRPVSVFLPARPEQPMRVGLAPPGHEHGAPMIVAFVDQYRQSVVELRDPRTYDAAETFMAWQHALHAGNGLGWTWRILVFLSGFLPVLFTITGVAMWLIRRRRRPAQRPVPAE